MELTQVVDWIGKPHLGYMINAEFSEDNKEKLINLIQEIDQHFNDSVFCMPKYALHITLLDWVAPLVDYGRQNKNKLYAQIKTEYDSVMSETVSSAKSIDVHFNKIMVSPNTIYIVGEDNGEFQRIREAFVSKVKLLPNTKLPPQIIHSSLARFIKEINLSSTKDYVRTKKIDFIQKIDDFRLVRTTKEPMLEFEVLKTYKLL